MTLPLDDLGRSSTEPFGVQGEVPVETEVPEALFQSLQEFLRLHPQWDQPQVLRSALASFLHLNGSSERAVADLYLESLFRRDD
ncbi:MAG: DUF2811 domain-containing protein [Cyanobacteriota bacterium]